MIDIIVGIGAILLLLIIVIFIYCAIKVIRGE